MGCSTCLTSRVRSRRKVYMFCIEISLIINFGQRRQQPTDIICNEYFQNFGIGYSRVFYSSSLSFFTTSRVINELLLIQIVHERRANQVVENERYVYQFGFFRSLRNSFCRFDKRTMPVTRGLDSSRPEAC